MPTKNMGLSYKKAEDFRSLTLYLKCSCSCKYFWGSIFPGREYSLDILWMKYFMYKYKTKPKEKPIPKMKKTTKQKNPKPENTVSCISLDSHNSSLIPALLKAPFRTNELVFNMSEWKKSNCDSESTFGSFSLFTSHTTPPFSSCVIPSTHKL